MISNQHDCIIHAFSTSVFSLFFLGDVPLDVLTQIVATISDPSAMLGPEVRTQILFSFFFSLFFSPKKKVTAKFWLVIEISILEPFERNISYDAILKDFTFSQFHFRSVQSPHSPMITEIILLKEGQ